MRRLIADDPLRVGAWVGSRVGLQYHPQDCYALGVEQDGDIIGGVLYNQWNGASIAIHMAGEPGRPWITRAALKRVFYFPFEYLQVKKIIGYVRQTNTASRRLLEHLGFSLETRIEDVFPDGALLVYTMARDRCRFLGRA